MLKQRRLIQNATLTKPMGAVAGLIVVQGPRGKLYGTSGIVYEFLLPWMSGCNASLVYALLFLAIPVGIVWLFYRRRVFLKL